jgi:hypothetical protein
VDLLDVEEHGRGGRHHRGESGMSAAAVETTPSKSPRPLWWRIVWWALLVVVIGAAANLLGWDIRGWFHQLWNTVTSISAASLIAAIS